MKTWTVRAAHPRPGKPAGHRQHRQRGADRQELRDRADAAGESRGLRPLPHRRHCSQHGRSRCADRDSRFARGGHRGLRIHRGVDRPRARRQAAGAAAPRGGRSAGRGSGRRSGRHRRRAGGQRADQRGAGSLPCAGHHLDRSRATVRSIWPRRWRSWPTRSGMPAAGRVLPIKPPRNQAEPATSGQLEELFADWTRALWAIDFFKTRRPESVMRSFREIVFRAGLDGREASLLRAMGIEVVRYLDRHPRRRILMGRSSAYWTSNLYVTEAEEPVPTAPLDRPARATGARRFRALRAGLLEHRGVGPSRSVSWGRSGDGPGSTAWATASCAGCISCGASVDVTFTLSESDESRLAKGAKMAGGLARAIAGGPAHRPGQVVLAGAGATAARWTRSSIWPDARRNGSAERPAPRRAPRSTARKRQERRRSKPTELVGIRDCSGCVIGCVDYTSRAYTCGPQRRGVHKGSSSAVR